jgi:Protein of unknown function (DUF2961)
MDVTYRDEDSDCAGRTEVASSVGLDAFARLEDLPRIKRHTRAYGASSASDSEVAVVSDASDANDDYSNYVRQTTSERVLMDVVGTGAIYRFWHTDDAMDAWAPGGSDASGSDMTYKFYFDDESSPSLILPARQLWRGSVPGFPAPLSLDADESSGGGVSYRPITFARGVRVSLANAASLPKHDYFNIGYSLYPRDAVETFTGCENVGFAKALLEHAGDSPITKHPEDRTSNVAFDLVPGMSRELGHWVGPAMITELVISVPNMRREEYPVIEDAGRVHRGTSDFRLAVSPQAEAVRITRRLADDHPQRALVYVDGTLAGTWSTQGTGDGYSPTRAVNAWLDSAFGLPPALASGKEHIQVRIDARAESGAEGSWNEFRYWATSTAGGSDIATDELDIGDRRSEAAHQYVTSAVEWTGTHRYRPIEPVVIPGANDGRALEQVRLQIFWDDASEPAVDAPFAEFFGTGGGFVADVKALMLGHEKGRFYCYFPMPFARSARIVLVHPQGAPMLRELSAAIRIRPYTADFSNVAYFHASAQRVDATEVGKDYDILVASGQGHYVGANLVLPGMNWTLEGDEHIFVDGLRTPSISGTGTEDYVNGGWYFSRGPFSAPFSGSPERAAPTHPVTAYRHHITDAVPFRTSIRVALEHDGINSNQVPYASVAYYYLKSSPGMSATDFFEPARVDSREAHEFLVHGGEPRLTSASGRFFRDAPVTSEYHDGMSLDRSSSCEFTMRIDPNNDGAVIRRMFDQASRDQRAEVYVNGAFAGVWYSAGGSDRFRWREDEFWVPAEQVRGRSDLRIQLNVHSAQWSAYEYQAFTVLAEASE